MLDTISNIFFNIYARWADRSIIKIKIKHLDYVLRNNHPNSPFVIISSCSSYYSAEVEFSHSGKATTIKDVMLMINDQQKLEPSSFNPIKLEHGDYKKETLCFPIEEKLAVQTGSFEMQVIYDLEKIKKLKGKFPC